jgi:ATP-dependent Clp protease ATP-binding subunit ClpC
MTGYDHLIVSREMGLKTQNVYDFLIQRVLGQGRAARRLAQGLSIDHSGLKDSRQPIGVFLFAGPTGTGKTMMAETLARCLIADLPKAPLTRIPCTKLSQAHEVTSLTGAPPSYVGFDRPSQLQQDVIDAPDFRMKARGKLAEIQNLFPKKEERIAAIDKLRAELGPYRSVILFDEIEKAHPTIWNLLLNIVGDGELAMNDATSTSFANSIIILTCNVGGREQQERMSKGRIGFSRGASAESETDQRDEELYRLTLKRIEQTFDPEFIGRIKDSIIVFRHPSPADVRRALLNHYDNVRKRLGHVFGQDPVTLDFDEGYTTFLLQEGYNQRYGMRPLDQAVKRHCVLPLAVALESKEIRPGDKILFVVEDGQVRMRRANRVPRPLPKPAPAPRPTTLRPAPLPSPRPTPLLPSIPQPPAKPEEPKPPKKDGE